MSLGRPQLHLRETDSTNERAKALAIGGAPHGTLVTAEAQTAGHGRLGRAWVAPPGSSVLASLVVRGLGERLAYLPLAAAVAVSEACECCAPVACTIKWPNDVWIDGRKVAGILLEGRPEDGWAVLGIGLNVATRAEDFPADLSAHATSLAAATPGARPPAVEDALAALLAALARRLGAPPEEVVSAWSERDALRDRRIRWDGGEGLGRGIAASGALRVETAAGELELHAGEVALVRPADHGG
ncbi:MAG TPA: biotin--[acetyl-CoA-carboxylase] ligase [Thermoleophilaceae bacterium]|nr:biotin--[acetyl-CoA-carboxylase] ligase [Thermoleophilaceae bacterium]